MACSVPVSSWWTHLVERAPAESQAALALSGLDVRRGEALAAARARWPEAFAVTDGALIEALASGLAAHKDADAALARLRLDDLLLARCCATGDARAIAAFELADDALDSIVRDADSRLDLSLSRVLASPVLADGTDGGDGGVATP